MRWFSILAMLLCLACAGCASNGEYYDGSLGREFNRLQVEKENQHYILTGEGEYRNPEFY